MAYYIEQNYQRERHFCWKGSPFLNCEKSIISGLERFLNEEIHQNWINLKLLRKGYTDDFQGQGGNSQIENRKAKLGNKRNYWSLTMKEKDKSPYVERNILRRILKDHHKTESNPSQAKRRSFWFLKNYILWVILLPTCGMILLYMSSLSPKHFKQSPSHIIL